NLYGKDLFRIPEVYIAPVGARIMSLQNPLAKMSKSDPDPNGAVYLTDTNDQILKKVKRAVTDSGTEITFEETKPGINNLLTIQAAITGKTIPEIVNSYIGKQYGHLKVDAANLLVETLGPIRDKTDELIKDRSYLLQVLEDGAERARERAGQTLKEVYRRVGLV
ncbi:MAG TPA: tryptophan--tRNA ligase, partial [Bdellovibrionota bacterium]|nr:tryptophan--tRNA ligase [Bdellovibrionota bacterium]